MIRNIKMSVLIASTLLTLFSGCGYDNENENVVGNNLVVSKDTLTPLVDVSKAALQAGFNHYADATGTTAQTALIGVKAYKIDYTTTDDNGNAVQASGLITVPALTPEFMKAYKTEHKSDFSLSIVSDQHGTIFSNAEAPSVEAATTHAPNSLSSLFSGVAGFMTVQPDYIGYGDSNVSHPFILEKSLANSTVDMIKAAIAFANKAGLPINGQVYLSGYSEGGFATLAAAKEIQENHTDITLKAVAPMAGPYDLETIGIATLTQTTMSFPPFLAYIVKSYSDTYSDVNASEIITKKYVNIVNTIFDGTYTATEAYVALPNILSGDPEGQNTEKLFQTVYMQDFLNDETVPLREHFVENSPIDWKPQMPMKLIHCSNDEIIPYVMSENAYNAFVKQGATSVELVAIDDVNATLPDSVHTSCATSAYAKVLPWFASIRSGGN